MTITQQDKTLAVLTHVLGLFTWFIGPLVVYLASEDDYVTQNARNALNWQISYTLYGFVSLLLVLLLVGFLLLWALGILNLVVCIIAAVRASDGVAWDYPLTIAFLKE